MKTALIISTYNWSAALELVLRQVECQTRFPDVVIVADDGSTEETQHLVDETRMRWLNSSFPVKLLHVWQEDKGFRLSRIRNKALAKAATLGVDYVIQIDGDILMERHFVEDHVRASRPATLLCGMRVYISTLRSYQLLTDKKSRPLSLSFLSRGIEHRENAVRWPWLSMKKENKYRVQGCNMSYFLSDAMAINGYDEEFEGWGYEDLDFVFRMQLLGVRQRRLKFRAVCFHLFHPSNESHVNNDLFHQKEADQQRFCSRGIRQHLSS